MKNIFIVYAVLFGAFIGISLPLPLLGPLILSEDSPFSLAFDQRYLFLSLALAAFPLGNLIGAPVMGYISDRLGEKLLLLLGLLGASLFYVLSGFAIAQGNYFLLLASRFLCGLCEGNAAIAQSYIAKDADPAQKPKLMGSMIAVISVGYVAGPLIGAFFTNAHLVPYASMALPFYFVAAFLLLTAVFVAIRFKNTSHLGNSSVSSLSVGFKQLFQQTIFTRLIILTILLAIGRSLYIDFLSSYLKVHFAMTTDQSTWLWVLLAIIWGATALFCDFAKKRLSYEAKMTLACVLAGTCVIFLAFSDSILTTTLLSILIVFGLALAGAINAVLVSDSASKAHMGLAMGILSSTYLCGEVAACFGGGFLLRLSDEAPFIMSGSFLWVASAGFLLLGWRAKKHQPIRI
jgi:MFS family permease